jgi:diacylglycerol O-acyltransferase
VFLWEVAMTYERLTAADAAFLRVETPHEPQHVGSLSVLQGTPLRDPSGRIRFDELRDHVAARLHRVPQLRQRIMEVPLGQGRPVWVDDHEFDLDYHLRVTAVPRPGDDEQLSVLMGRLQSLPLDRRRPLWEMWLIDGLAGDEIGLVIKTHHALGDGIANVDLAMALVDLDPEPADEPAAPPWRPRRSPSPNRLLADSAWDQLTRPARLTRSALRAARDPRPAIDSIANVARAATNFLSKPEPAPWNVPVTPHRRWVHADIPLEVVRHVRRHHAVSINDVVLAACTGALREFLLDHHETADRVLKAMVPVSLRTDDEHGNTLGNRVSLIVVDLPVNEPDPLARLRQVHDHTSELKGSGLVDGAEAIVRLADGITPVLAAPLTRLVSRQIPMNLVITNIPGPPVPLYLNGARILRTYPYVEVIDNEGLTIAVVSYEDQLFFGITSDRDVIPDLDLVAESIEKEFHALAAAAGP